MANRSSETLKYVFGPVPSRRLGRSLGVDLAPRKTCSFDCVYCQVGRTMRLTTLREMFVPAEEILVEVRAKLQAGPRPDFITLSGSGEPTLNLALGTIIEGVRAMTDVRIAVLTNGSMFRDPAVRAACAKADVVLPTLDAADEETFQAIHRPAPGLLLADIVEGLVAFRREFSGEIWLEVFVIKGVNDRSEQLQALRKLIARVAPDRVQLNTAVRPTADAGIQALTPAQMEECRRLLGDNAEVIADFKTPEAGASAPGRCEEVLDMVRRRPVTLDDIISGMGLPSAEASEYVKELLGREAIYVEKRGEREYFRAVK